MSQVATPERPILKTKRQAAEYLGGISPRTLERMVKDGQVRSVRLRGRVMFKTTDLDAAAR